MSWTNIEIYGCVSPYMSIDWHLSLEKCRLIPPTDSSCLYKGQDLPFHSKVRWKRGAKCYSYHSKNSLSLSLRIELKKYWLDRWKVTLSTFASLDNCFFCNTINYKKLVIENIRLNEKIGYKTWYKRKLGKH